MLLPAAFGCASPEQPLDPLIPPALEFVGRPERQAERGPFEIPYELKFRAVNPNRVTLRLEQVRLSVRADDLEAGTATLQSPVGVPAESALPIRLLLVVNPHASPGVAGALERTGTVLEMNGHLYAVAFHPRTGEKLPAHSGGFPVSVRAVIEE